MLHAHASFVLLCAVVGAQAGDEPKPTREPLDRTGVAWTLPFSSALARAKAEQRLLFVPVIAGGTDATGCW